MIEKGEEVLVQIRTKKDWPGITFPGGKVEIHESIYDSTVREVREETGLEVKNLNNCGIIHYDVNNGEERWVIYLYKTSDFSGTLLTSSEEGELLWMKKTDLFLPETNLSLDLDIYLKLYEDESLFEAFTTWQNNTSGKFIFY